MPKSHQKPKKTERKIMLAAKNVIFSDLKLSILDNYFGNTLQ